MTITVPLDYQHQSLHRMTHGRQLGQLRIVGESWPVVRSGVDLLRRAAAADFDLAWFGPLGDGDPHGEHPGLVAGLDAVGVEGVTEEQLARKHALGSLLDLDLDVFADAVGALGVDGQDVALHVEVD